MTLSHRDGVFMERRRLAGPAVLMLLLLLLPSPLAANKLFLHDSLSAVPLSPDVAWRRANSTQGTGILTAVTNSTGADVTGQYWSSTTAGHIITKTAGGTRTVWISDPLSAGVTISGTITPNLWGLESAAQCNCTARYQVLRWDVSTGGIVGSLGISTDDGMSEWGTSAAVRTAPTLTPASTAFNTGDRIMVIVYNDDPSGLNQGASRTWTLNYDAATGVNGDTYLNFTETISYSADNNNLNPHRGITAVAPASSRPVWSAGVSPVAPASSRPEKVR